LSPEIAKKTLEKCLLFGGASIVSQTAQRPNNLVEFVEHYVCPRHPIICIDFARCLQENRRAVEIYAVMVDLNRVAECAQLIGGAVRAVPIRDNDFGLDAHAHCSRSYD
jgi:hypothetical protein